MELVFNSNPVEGEFHYVNAYKKYRYTNGAWVLHINNQPLSSAADIPIAKPTVAVTAPTLPHNNPFWQNSTTGDLYYQKVMGATTTWDKVNITPEVTPPFNGGTITTKLTGTLSSMGGYLDKTFTNATATGTVNLDLGAYNTFDLTLTGNTTLELTNVPTLTNETLSFMVRVNSGATAYTLTWFTGLTWLTTNNLAPTAPAVNKVMEVVFSTKNGTAYLGRKGPST